MLQQSSISIPYAKLFWWLMGATTLLLFIHLGAAPIYILDEVKNAQCAREMLESGNYIVPTFNGVLRTDKPVLHYWFMLTSYKLFGVGYWQARLFSAFAGLVTVAAVYYFVQKRNGKSLAFWAALCLAISPHFLFEFRLSVPDPYLILFTTLGLFCLLEFFLNNKLKWILLASSWLALATLAKGPVALALPGLVSLIYIVVYKQWSTIFNWRLLVALVLYMAIAAPWYYLVHLQTNGAFTTGFFIEHNLNRVSSEKEGHGGNFFIVPLIVLVGMLPFSLLLFRYLRKKYIPKSNTLQVFALITMLVYTIFFGFSSTKLPNYPMPCYPFVAVMVAVFLQKIVEGNLKWPMYTWWVWLFIGLALPIGGFFALGLDVAVASEKYIVLGLLVLPISIALGWMAIKRKQLKQALIWIIMGWFIFDLYFLAIAYPTVYLNNPVTVAYKQIDVTNAQFVSYKAFNPAFLYQNKQKANKIFETQNIFELEAVLETIDKGKQVYIITRQEFMKDLDPKNFQEIFSQRDLFELPTTTILTFKR